jgi:hypothetical protein
MMTRMQVGLNPSPASIQMLVALNTLNKPMYEGTVPAAEKRRRRARNKRAKASRKANRG